MHLKLPQSPRQAEQHLTFTLHLFDISLGSDGVFVAYSTRQHTHVHGCACAGLTERLLSKPHTILFVHTDYSTFSTYSSTWMVY